jgi:hypothetical protein
MSYTDRQNRLLLAEDWKKVYQSFKFADFKSYDFDTLRRTMISYLRTNYPEDFNDYIESSEYLALIDMIAFLGQNIAFRVDLNARENFLELAERKESVLRLAQLLSYNPTRNKSANGLLKITSVSTTENVSDSNGFNLSNRSIIWNDTVNPDWFEQYIKVVNAALPIQNSFGRPIKLDTVSGIPTEQYRFSSSSTGIPVYAFSKPINNQSFDFEVVSSTISNGEIVEDPPLPNNQLSFLYRDNGQGAGSNSTGFFMHFRQGSLKRNDLLVDFPTPNQKIDIDVQNINDTDIWLYSLDSLNNESELWTKVSAVEGNNIVYNSLSKQIKNIYSVLTRVDDRVSLVFSDGIFGNLPKGKFRVYYRTSANKDYTILPANIKNVAIRIPYISKIGRKETITCTLELKTAVDNASSTETVESIKTNAPATYYTQNRLITAEDYNIGPLGISQDIIKVKAVNRTSSGISRYYDLIDATGKYSKTNLFGTDGILYTEYKDKKDNFTFVTRTDIESIIENKITDILGETNVRSFYLKEFPDQNYVELNLKWVQVTADTNRSTGYFSDENSIKYQVGNFTEGPLRFIEAGAMIKFVSPANYYFLPNGTLTTNANAKNATSYKWVKVVSVTGDGTTVASSGLGPIIFNDIIPNDSVLTLVKPKFVKEISDDIKISIVDQIFAYRTFGLRYDRETRSWEVITQDNLNVLDDFNLGLAGDETGQSLDSSWIVLFETTGSAYDVTYRTLRYIFESNNEIRFYFDNSKKIFDSKSGKIIKDRITVLNINNDINNGNGTAPFTRDFDWEISGVYRDGDGYVDSKKVEVTFFDSDDDGIIDDPQIFTEIVNQTNYIFNEKVIINNNEFVVYIDASTENIITVARKNDINMLVENNPIYYVIDEDRFYQLTTASRTLTVIYDYYAYIGRPELKFQYIHASDENNRIDPSSSNIIDTFILTKQYDSNFRQWLSGTTPSMPSPPSTDQLYRSYGSEINAIKSISDEIIYHPVRYKVLFGSKSDTNMQAVFKIVKNPERVVNDNDLKSRVITAINQYFTLDNWDFGETFYWSELSAYIIKELSPDLSSIVIVPRSSDSAFGSLHEIKAESDEIFISSATVDDVEVISAITAERLRSTGTVVTGSTTNTTGLQSSVETTNTNTGGFIY